MDIVSTDKPYTYLSFRQELFLLKNLFPFLTVESVGKSVLGKDIYSVRLGIGSKKIFYSASIHANEWITSIVLMKFIEDYCDSYFSGLPLNDISIKSLFNSFSFFIIPMVNPDGVDLVNNVYSEFSYPFMKAQSISDNYPNIPFPNGWKANINGVDLKIYQPVCKVL